VENVKWWREIQTKVLEQVIIKVGVSYALGHLCRQWLFTSGRLVELDFT
jgi:hypothetical protein